MSRCIILVVTITGAKHFFPSTTRRTIGNFIVGHCDIAILILFIHNIIVGQNNVFSKLRISLGTMGVTVNTEKETKG
jgi:hypothetical protein